MKMWLLRLFLILSAGFLFPDSPVPPVSPERAREIWETAVEIRRKSEYLAYPFTMPSGDHIFSGIARVRERDGMPFDVRYNPSPLPLFADFLEISLRFTPYEEGLCIVSEASYRYSGSFLFFRDDGEGSIETGGWVRLPVKPRLE